jgi:hypothetical protein|tara:strand:- start:2004 stop:2726 length:723 start_codon:yes stop_codon:yes gene_type:complete
MSNVLKDSSILLNNNEIKNLLNEIKINWIDKCLDNKFKWYPYWANKEIPNQINKLIKNNLNVFDVRCNFDVYERNKFMNVRTTSKYDQLFYRPKLHYHYFEYYLNLKKLCREILNKDIILSQTYPMWYKKYKNINGYMGWHTNHNTPGERWYFVYNTDNNNSCIRFIHNEKLITHWEPEGWSINNFDVNNENNPVWHCIYSKTNRFSFGLKTDIRQSDGESIDGNLQKILMSMNYVTNEI